MLEKKNITHKNNKSTLFESRRKISSFQHCRGWENSKTTDKHLKNAKENKEWRNEEEETFPAIKVFHNE